KGLSCQYGTTLTFVASKLQDRLESTPATPPRPRSPWASIRAAVPPTTPPTGVPYLQPHHSFPSNESAVVGPGHFEVDFAPESSPGEQPSALKTPSADVDYAGSNVDRSRDSHAVQSRAARSPLFPGDANTRRKEYELELFTHYCYHVAPVLDLGLGSLSFGVQAVLDSKTLETIYHAIIAVASSHRAAVGSLLHKVDEATSITSAHLAYLQVASPDWSNLATSRILLLYRSLMLAPIESWPTLAPEILNLIHRGAEVLEEWQVLSRLHLAASLIEAPTNGAMNFMPPPHATVDGREYGHLRQLSLALWLLEQNLAFLRHST
ncbi:MAG: hypothetical protein M1823_006523, partial [Watsoniomyces obsoletus]